MPERKSGRFLNMGFLPFRNIKMPVLPDKDGNPLYMDFTRFVPGGDIMDLNGTLPGVPAPLQPSGGLAGEILFPLAGYDLFRQQKIKGLTGNYSEDWMVKLEAIKNKLIPNIPFVPGTYSTKKIERARGGMESAFRPDQTEFYALAQSLGFKIEKADIDKLKAGKAFELKRKLDGYKEQMNIYRKKFRDGLINEDTARVEIEKIAGKMEELAAKYGVAFEKADYAQNKKPLFGEKN